MNQEDLKPTPEPTLRRLPRYLHLLNKLKEEDIKEISSTMIANELSLDPTQVRKDIEFTGIIGRPKIGFNTFELIKAIENFLNWNNLTEAFLVGVGNLGRAIMGYNNFKRYGLSIVTAFDVDPEKIGNNIHDIPVFNLDKLPDLARRMHINIGVITAPPQFANQIATLMIESGIKAIWNFAPTQLKVPYNIVVENALLSTSISVLKRKLAENLEIENLEEVHDEFKK